MNRSYTSEKDFYETVEDICKYPRKCTQNGTFFEVTSYLEGFAHGAKVDVYAHSFSTPFFVWLEEKKRLDLALNWTIFRNMFTSDDEALRNLAILYKEYISK